MMFLSGSQYVGKILLYSSTNLSISLFKNYGNFQLFTKLFGYSGHYLFGNPDFKINKASSVLHLYGVTQNMVAEDWIVVY